MPTLVGDHFEGRHVDLRRYILYGKEIIGRTDGSGFKPVFKLRYPTVDAGFRGIHSLLKPLKAAAERLGDEERAAANERGAGAVGALQRA